MTVCPYKKGTWSYEYHLSDWLDGWKEAAEAFEMAQEGAEARQQGNEGVEKIERLMDAFEEAAVANSWKGGGRPEDIPAIEKDYELARKKLFDYIVTK